jgi:hypothetical protein
MLKTKTKWLIAGALALSSCGGGNETLEGLEKKADLEAAADGKIECALAGRTDFNRDCSTERVTGAEGQLLIIRNPDGGFRRFTILGGGKGLEPADGFDDSFRIKLINDDMIEVRSGDDIYRLPAAIKSGADAKKSKAPE